MIRQEMPSSYQKSELSLIGRCSTAIRKDFNSSIIHHLWLSPHGNHWMQGHSTTKVSHLSLDFQAFIPCCGWSTSLLCPITYYFRPSYTSPSETQQEQLPRSIWVGNSFSHWCLFPRHILLLAVMHLISEHLASASVRKETEAKQFPASPWLCRWTKSQVEAWDEDGCFWLHQGDTLPSACSL